MVLCASFVRNPLPAGTALLRHVVRLPSLLLIGRLVSVVLGSLTVWIVGLAGEHAFGRRAGLAAAAILAIAPACVVHGHPRGPSQ